MLSVRELTTPRPELCEPILRALPEWFGIETAIQGYVALLPQLRTFVAERDGETVGFLALERHDATRSEIHVMGVRPAAQRFGVGRALVAAAVDALRADGTTVLEVKTLGPSRVYEPYARTRAFYAALGFVAIEERFDVWDERNPCLIMRRPLA